MRPMPITRRNSSDRGERGHSGGGHGSSHGGGNSPQGSRGGYRSKFTKKICRFCADKLASVDYKDAEKLKRFLTEKGKIIPSRITGNCAKHQRMLAGTVKRARHASVVAFQSE